MSKITTVVFDAFGTLFQDSPEHWDAAMEQIIRGQGLAVSVETLNREWLAACGDFRNTRSEPTADFQTYTVAWRDAFVEAFRVLNLAGDAAAAADHWIRDMGSRQPYPETLEALEAVARTRRVVVLSNADDAFLDPYWSGSISLLMPRYHPKRRAVTSLIRSSSGGCCVGWG